MSRPDIVASQAGNHRLSTSVQAQPEALALRPQ